MDDYKIQKTIGHLDFFTANTPVALFQNLSEKIPSSVEWFTIGMIQRLVFSSRSLKLLLTNYEESEEHEFAIGIILRAILLDGLIGLNLLLVLKESLNANDMKHSIEKVNSYCMAVLGDSLVNTLKYFNGLHKDGLLELDALKDNFNEFTISYSEFLEQPDGTDSMPVAKYKISAASATGHFKQLSKDSDLRKIGRRFFDLYQIYSKYDHFGFLYHRLKNTDSSQKIGKIWSSIELFVNHYANMCDLLDRVTQNNPTVKNMHVSASKYLTKRNIDRKT